MMDLIQRARELRAMIETLSATLDDEKALEAPELFPRWESGVKYAEGIRIFHGSKLYRILQAHTSQDNWSPDAEPSLFAEVLPGQDGTDIGVWVQPDSTNPYMTGDRVYYPDMNGKIYESKGDNNVWSPEAYPDGWQVIE